MELRLVLPLAGSGRAAHTPQPGSAQAQTHALGLVASHSGLPHYQDHRGGQAQQLGSTVRAVWDTSPHGWAGKRRGHTWDRCCSPAEGPTVSKRLTEHSVLQRKGSGVQSKTQGLERETSRFTNYRESNYMFLY